MTKICLNCTKRKEKKMADKKKAIKDVEEVADSAADLDAIATQAAKTYYDMAVKYGVSKYPLYGFRKSRYWNRFMQIARICKMNEIPVDVFVIAAFRKTMERKTIVTPTDICAFNVENFRQKVGEGLCPDDMWNMLSCKLIDMVFALDCKGTMDILDNAMYGFPAWFRVFSPETPPADIIARWGDIAHEEISSNKALAAYLKAKRPDTYLLLDEVVQKI